MFCILLANLRKQVKTPYNLLDVNSAFLACEQLTHLTPSDKKFGRGAN